jgi:hypothetical protein
MGCDQQQEELESSSATRAAKICQIRDDEVWKIFQTVPVPLRAVALPANFL